jgi:hypothetical protein
MTGIVTLTIKRRLPLARDFSELSDRANSLVAALQSDGIEVVSMRVEQYLEAEDVAGEVRA